MWDVERGSLAQLLEAVSKKHRVTPQHIKGPMRHSEFVQARIEFAKLAYQSGRYSFPQIGRYLERDHTTIMYYVKKAYSP